MKTLELTDEEFETLEEIFSDWGSDCPGTDWKKYRALGEKLKFLEPIPEPTPEELKRREEFAENMRPIIEASNHLIEGMLKHNALEIAYGVKSLIGTDLRIRLPNDYVVKE